MKLYSARVSVEVDKTDFSKIGGILKGLGLQVHEIKKEFGIIKGVTDEHGIKNLIASGAVSFIDYKLIEEQ